MKEPLKLAMAVLLCEFIGIVSTPFTISAINTWYVYLHKPFFSPPNWVFGPVWTTLYVLMAVAAYLIWIKGINNKKVKTALLIFILQLVLNFKWSLIFFGLHAPLLALIEILILWLAILFTILKFYELSKPAAYLMIPYIVWVSFATLLNFSIVILNP